MKNTMKAVAVALMLGFVLNAQALTNTSHGVTMTDDMTLSEFAADVRVVEPLADQSVYPTFDNRHGTIVRWYSFAKRGGTVGTVSLEPSIPQRANGLTNIPDNTVIAGGFVQTITPLTPFNATNRYTLDLNAVGDVAGLVLTNLGTANAISPIIPNLTYGTNVVLMTTNNLPLNFGIGTTITQGLFMVVLDVYKGQ